MIIHFLNWINPALNIFNPLLSIIGFILTILTFIFAFQINKKVNNTIDHADFHKESAQLIGFYQNINDELQALSSDDEDLKNKVRHIQLRLAVENTRIKTKYPFISKELKTSFEGMENMSVFSRINFDPVNKESYDTGKLELAKRLIQIDVLLSKENRK